VNSATNLPLENISPSGAVPRTRVKDANAAGEIVELMLRSYRDGRGKINATISGCLDGNPPFDDQELIDLGQSWRSNLNFRLLEADISFAMVPYYSLFSEVPIYCDIQTKSGTRAQRSEWSRIISEEHTRAMKRWKGFAYQMQLSIAQRVTFGSGPIYYPQCEDPRFKAARYGEVHVPMGSSADVNELALAVILREYAVTELYNAIENPAASKAGWNVSAVKEAIVNSCNSIDNEKEDYEAWQTRIRHNDLYYAMKAPSVKTAHVFVREFDGNISHYIVVESGGNGEYLYQYKDRFERWQQILHPNHAEIGDGYWHGIKGLGLKAFNFRDTQNRLKNHTVDAAVVGSQVLLKPNSPDADEALDVIPMGPFARLPYGVEYTSNPIGSTLDKPLMVDRSLEIDLMRNIGGYRQNLTDSKGQAITATEAQINASQQQTLSQQTHDLFVADLDTLYEEQVSRFCADLRPESKDAPYLDWEQMIHDFQKACTGRGVPKAALKNIVSVRAYRSIGQGSKFFKNQINEKILSVFPMLPEDVRQRHLRNYLSGIASQEYVEAIWPSEDLVEAPSDDASKAQDENGTMLQGLSPVWTPQQNNVAHAEVHMGLIAQLLEQVTSGGASPEKLLGFSQVAFPHIEFTLGKIRGDSGQPTNIEVLQNIRGGEFQKLWNSYKQLLGAVQKIGQEYQAQLEAQAQQQAQAMQQAVTQAQQAGQVDVDSQIKMAKAQQDMAITEKKAMLEMQLKQMAAAQDRAIKDANAAADIRRSVSKE
jgi:hypothetical protein